MGLITTFDELRETLRPVLAGDVGVAAFDTETTEVPDDRFTPYGTDVRMAGFSISFDCSSVHGHPDPGVERDKVDLYAAVRHEPYDWRRQSRLVPAEWRARLLDEEGVTLDGHWKSPEWNPNLPLDECRDLIREAFAVLGVSWRAHNWPFDAKIVLVDGIELPDEMFDTQIYSVLTDERPLDEWDEENSRFTHRGHALKLLCELYLGIKPEEKDLLDLARKALECNSWAHLPLRTVIAPYACRDTRDVLDLADHMLARPLAQDVKILQLIAEHHDEMRHNIAMEGVGIKIDVPEARRRAAEREALLPQIADRAPEIDIASPKDTSDKLYGPAFMFPKYRGKSDTRKDTLKQVRALVAGGAPTVYQDPAHALELLDTILEYRKVQKELTAFYRPLVEYADPEGTIYTTLNALRAATTRFSSSKPNLQQTQRLKKGANPITSVRSIFKPRDGHVFITPDYGQQELRVAGHFALAIPSDFRYCFTWRCTLPAVPGIPGQRQDCKGSAPHGGDVVHVGRMGTSSAPSQMKLVQGFLSGDRAFDPHQIMADAAGVDRDTGKTADFALLYGAGIAKVAETLDCSFEFAKKIFLSFWNDAFPELGHVRNFIGERLRHKGPESMWSHQKSIRTLHGGRIFLASAYKGVNYVVQRSCREILLKAIIGVGEVIKDTPYHMLFPVHDQLIIEAPSDSLDQALVQKICKSMVDAGSASKIPMVVEGSVCRDNWAQTEKLDGWGWCGVSGGPL